MRYEVVELSRTGETLRRVFGPTEDLGEALQEAGRRTAGMKRVRGRFLVGGYEVVPLPEPDDNFPAKPSGATQETR